MIDASRLEYRGLSSNWTENRGKELRSPFLSVRISSLSTLNDERERFTYEYDFGDSWVHDIRIEAILPIDAAKRYPVCVAGKCSAPPEDCGGPDAFMENRWQYEAVGSGESREELEGLIDDVEEEEWEIARRYHSGRFDRAL